MSVGVKALIGRRQMHRLAGFASAQMLVQALGFGAGLLLVRAMEPAQYALYTLAISLAGVATVLADLGLGNAVLSLGGRANGGGSALRGLLAEALRQHGRLALIAAALLGPAALALLLNQQASPGQALLLTLMLVATALLNARAGLALSVTRVLGQVMVQQKLDLWLNGAKLLVLALLLSFVMDATLACAVNLGLALLYWQALSRHLAGLAPAPATGGPAMRALVRRQAPNSLWFIFSSQLSLWLVGLLGSAEHVAEIGALGRLAALFALIGTVSAALVLPWFARREAAAELAQGLARINLFYAALLALLLGLGAAFPGPLLWLLGGHYGGLQAELCWMIAAATLAAWGGTLYSVGCARGWVMPLPLVALPGMLAMLAAAATVDVASVRGSFVINTAGAAAGTLASLLYLAFMLRRQALVPAPAGAP